jgi:hypothetical protein
VALDAENRSEIEATIAGLVGRRIDSIAYWGLPPFDDGVQEPWDYGTWHHAVMGVEFGTDRGPVSLLGTDTFWLRGVEPFLCPAAELLSKECVRHDVTTVERWNIAREGPIRAASIHWERFRPENPWPSTASPYDVPVGFRLDFDSGSLWMVPVVPMSLGRSDVFIPGDELMVIFEPVRLREIGFSDDFVA